MKVYVCPSISRVIGRNFESIIVYLRSTYFCFSKDIKFYSSSETRSSYCYTSSIDTSKYTSSNLKVWNRTCTIPITCSLIVECTCSITELMCDVPIIMEKYSSVTIGSIWSSSTYFKTSGIYPSSSSGIVVCSNLSVYIKSYTSRRSLSNSYI